MQAHRADQEWQGRQQGQQFQPGDVPSSYQPSGYGAPPSESMGQKPWAGGVDQGPSETYGYGEQKGDFGSQRSQGAQIPSSQQQFQQSAQQQSGRGSERWEEAGQQQLRQPQERIQPTSTSTGTGYKTQPLPSSEKPEKRGAKDAEAEAHRRQAEAASISKKENEALMKDRDASLGTRASAAGKVVHDWATETKHSMQAGHHDKKVGEKERESQAKDVGRFETEGGSTGIHPHAQPQTQQYGQQLAAESQQGQYPPSSRAQQQPGRPW